MINPLVMSIVAAIGALAGYATPWAQFPAAALLVPFALMLLGLAAPNIMAAFRYCWIAGTTASLVCLYWVFWPVQHYGEVNWLLALPVPVLLSMAMGCYHGLFGIAARLSNRLSPVLAALFLGLAWTLMELAMATLLSGFPWLTLSSAFVTWPLMVQTASFVGAYGVSGLLALLVSGLVLVSRSRATALVSLCAAVVLIGVGWMRYTATNPAIPGHTVALVQGNIDQSLKWNPDYQRATVDKYLNLSRDVSKREHPELIIWPETAMPFYFQDETDLRKPVLSFVREGQAALLLGSPAYEMAGLNRYILYNRAHLLLAQNTAHSWYDKEHLVPFGEYVPLAGLLPLQKLVSAVGDFAPGRNEKALRVGDLALGVLVCYEAIFADLAQERVSQGANILVNISNDAWFGDTSAPHQHLQLTALRAIEQGRYLVRSTNTGISAFIDPLGRIRQAGPQFTELAAAGTVYPIETTTFFHRYYTELLALAGVLALVFAALIYFGEDESEIELTIIEQAEK